MFQGGFVSWFLFYSFLPFALYALYLFFISIQNYTAVRSFSKSELFARDELTVTIQVKRNHSFPLLFLMVEDSLSPSSQKLVKHKKNRVIVFLGFKKEFSFQYEIHNLPRGEHEFPSIIIMTCDFLGMIEKEKRIKQVETILVFPSNQEFAHVPANQMLEQSMLLTRGHENWESSTVVGIREYQPGDRFSWINWKASAKRADMVTKEFEHYSSLDALIVLDRTPTAIFESMVSFAASLGQILLYKGTQVGFLAVSEEPISMPIRGGEASRRQLFYHLAKVQPSNFKPFEKVLLEEQSLMRNQAALLLVTSHLSLTLIEEASKMTARKCPVILFVIQPDDSLETSFQSSLKLRARAHGILVVFIHEGQYATGRVEVNRA